MIDYIMCAMRGRDVVGEENTWTQQIELGSSSISYAITTVRKDTLILEIENGDDMAISS